MARSLARSPRATLALGLVQDLQRVLVDALRSLELRSPPDFVPVAWERDEGRHGGGMRYENAKGPLFNRASVNVSQVHYDDLPEKKLASATALSSIVHPAHPLAPSVHLHVSYTEMRDEPGYFRIMADLNPSHEVARDTEAFSEALQEAAPELYTAASAQGDRYFYIPCLERTRGVSHFYLEGYRTTDLDADCALAREVAQAAIRAYTQCVARALWLPGSPTPEQRARQLAYHTLYFLQVLTLDRGTTSGLLVHDQNDVGILGSLPARVDRALLASWIPKQPHPQDALLSALVETLPAADPAPVGEATKRALAKVVREHYRAHPDALALQASGDQVPTTVENHR